MGDEVTLTINGKKATVKKGVTIVEAAKEMGIDIPVFCYHPKMEPVGMCRMCLVEIGRPLVDRRTGEIQRESDGSVKLWFGPKLETACTTRVADGMVVITNSDKVRDASKATLEFILTSHPLDCPVCDKGGECPLQNLTMAHGSSQSRFLFEDKLLAAKSYPLGELILLDRERCIKCGRCIRFQTDIVDDPVIEFYHRGRAADIVTYSEPGFDSYFSGNTTDICPVGALTSVDFRFKARPWQMKQVASICNHCPVGCNIVFDVRREARSGGIVSIKRVMPRQNEMVNEIWICDKGRFGYHYSQSEHRLTEPLVRKDGELVPVPWDEALDFVAQKFKETGSRVVTLAGGRLANEDLYHLNALTKKQGGRIILNSYMAGGDLVARFGLNEGSNLGEIRKGDAILVVASNLLEEAPLWWLRVKQASERGATLIVLNPRETKLERYADHIIRYAYGEQADALAAFLPEAASILTEEIVSAVKAFAEAKNGIIIYGSEGIGLQGSAALARNCAELLQMTGHSGKPNNGLIAAWHKGNIQGAWDVGFRTHEDLTVLLKKSGLAYIVAADPVGDDPSMAYALEMADFVIVQELFLTETSKLADVVLPAQAYAEREGTFTSGERRLQRFYPAIKPPSGTFADFTITAKIANRLGMALEEKAPLLVFSQLAKHVPTYQGLTYHKISEVVEQWPVIGREDLYYGGTSYDNHQGMGAQLPPFTLVSKSIELPEVVEAAPMQVPEGMLLVVPVTSLYDSSSILSYSTLLHQRMAKPVLKLHPELAEKHGLVDGDVSCITVNKFEADVEIVLDDALPLHAAILPRGIGIPIFGPVVATVQSPVPESET